MFSLIQGFSEKPEGLLEGFVGEPRLVLLFPTDGLCLVFLPARYSEIEDGLDMGFFSTFIFFNSLSTEKPNSKGLGAAA